MSVNKPNMCFVPKLSIYVSIYLLSEAPVGGGGNDETWCIQALQLRVV